MTLSALLEKARRRVWTHLFLDKGALAATIGLGGTVLLLLAGTAILEWYWVAALVVVSLGVGIYQIRKFIPSQYQVAQRIDRKLELADMLSTATYFGANPKLGHEAVCQLQLRKAEDIARGVDVIAALPLTRSRYVYPAGILLLVAGGLFIARFALLGSLDLKPSLIEIAVDTFFSTPEEIAARAKAPKLDLRPDAFDPTQANDPPSPEDLTPPIPEEGKDPGDLLKGDSQQKGGDGKDGKEKGLDNADQEGDGEGDKEGEPQDKQGGKQGDQKDGKNSSQNSDQRSMLDKLRDAVENLMNKMDPTQGDSEGAKGDAGKDQKGQKGEKGEKGQKGSADEPESESSDEGEPSDSSKDGKGSQVPGQKTAGDAQSGAGANDGDKAIQEAKTLEAMGKLSELLGQRANDVSGQVMIEVGNTKQQLRTAFTQQQAGHRESGSEIHRDEVPLIHQQFVERYFEEVRKGAPAPAKASPKQGK